MSLEDGAAMLTWDQGAEMAEHATVTGVLSDGVFFALPASPWQTRKLLTR